MNKRGFSLIELMTVLLIIGILLSIASMSGKAWMDKYRVESQVKSMMVDLSSARARAMNTRRAHFVLFESSRYSIYDDTDGNEMPDVAVDTRVMQKELSDQIAFDYDTITFNNRGLVSGFLGYDTDFRVTDNHGAIADCIVISATRMRIGGWNGSDCVAK